MRFRVVMCKMGYIEHRFNIYIYIVYINMILPYKGFKGENLIGNFKKNLKKTLLWIR